MRHGYSVISCGWQNDLPPFDGLIGMHSPDATNPDGSPITGRIWTQLQRGEDVSSMMLSDRDHRAYEAVDMDEPGATLTVRDMPDLPSETIPRDKWRFGRIDDNGEYVSDPGYVSLEGGFEKGRLYQVAYTTTGARVLGLGFAALRDCTSWIKHGDSQVDNPLAGHIEHAFSYGISQTGRLMRTFIYDDLNQDEEGREALDGIISNVAGGMRGGAVELAPCETIDTPCIANAEIVLEAEILPTGWTRPEGRFGEFTRLMGGLHWNPLVRVKAISVRPDPVYYALHMPWENIWPSMPVYEAAVRRVLKEAGVFVTAVNVTPGGCCHWHAIIAVKPLPGDGKNAIMAALSVADMKHVVIVDE
ncbi:MAG: UbiD family decarboxylase, partial [Chloroflexi bacterium]|nr:UbiD family decarboxylase [Chloroflexota bacterium]